MSGTQEHPGTPVSRLAWFPFRVRGSAAAARLSLAMRGVVHSISLTRRGGHRVRWITRGREACWEERAGAVHYKPADGDEHTFVTEMSPDFESAVLLIPEADLAGCLRADGCDDAVDWRRVLAADDRVLRSCMTVVAAADTNGDAGAQPADEAARALVLRLAELSGGRVPCWRADASAFDRRTLARVVDHVDAHLRVAPTLAEMGRLVGLSPSHFARKFRRSTGLSLERFVNRRRVRTSLGWLARPSQPLVEMARDLGFASQSHFTRVFSGLTGMTPAKYHKRFRRTIG